MGLVHKVDRIESDKGITRRQARQFCFPSLKANIKPSEFANTNTLTGDSHIPTEV